MEVWVIEAGDYEQRFIKGIADSIEAAVECIKGKFGPPYIVRWDELKKLDEDSYELSGTFSQVLHYSTFHVAQYDITRYSVSTKH